MLIVIQNNEYPLSCWFNEVERTPLFSYGDWRDLAFSYKANSDDKINSSDSILTFEDMTSSEHAKLKMLKSDLSENKVYQNKMNLNSEVSSHETIFENIFNIEKWGKQKWYADRRDVITKSILRYFYKYLWRSLSEKILRQTYIRSHDSLVQRVREVWFNLMSVKNNNVSNEKSTDSELILFVFQIIWINQRISRRNVESKKLFAAFNQNFKFIKENKCEASTIMASILKRYSHHQLQRLFENKTLRFLFKNFLDSESKNFLSKLPCFKIEKAKELIRDFETNISLFDI